LHTAEGGAREDIDHSILNLVKTATVVIASTENNPKFDDESNSCEREVQTDNFEKVSIGTNAAAPDTTDTGCMCGTVEDTVDKDAKTKQKIEDMVQAIMMANDSLLDTREGLSPIQAASTLKPSLLDVNGEITFESIMLAKTRQKIFQSRSVLEKLLLLERAVQQCNFGSQQVSYRGVPLAPMTDQLVPDEGTDGSNPTLDLLFNFHCTMTFKKIVTCISWHKATKDVLAIGYGGDRSNFDQEGMVMLWSLRNPSFPEQIIKTKSAVTSVSFSTATPTVLAVGMEDGCISLHDTSQANCSSVYIDTASTLGRHMSTVTQLLWIIDKQQNHPIERLISISIDGRVLQWSIKKGMCLHPLMTLQRQTIANSESKLPNIAMGLCIDFPEGGDSLTYVAGSEDGSLFMCSRSYTEQHVSQIKGHAGPVTKIKFSPMDKNIFLTCSADSSIKLWRCSNRQNDMKDVLTIEPANLWGPVNDVAWSPCVSTLFAIVTADGRIEAWDIAKSTLDPIITIPSESSTMSGNERTLISFAENGSNIVVGDEKGNVEVYSLKQYDVEEADEVELHRVISTMEST